MSIRVRGVTLIEMIVFIVIVGVAMAGLFAAFNTLTAGSADPQVRKQVLAIAESLMEEVQSMPFTYCDPDDPLAPTAGSSGACTAGMAEVIGVEGSEFRYVSLGSRYDNVSDYNGFSMSGIKDINEADITGLGGYSASVAVADAATDLGLGAGESLRISVTVTGPSGVTTTLEGFRTRYAPNTLP